MLFHLVFLHETAVRRESPDGLSEANQARKLSLQKRASPLRILNFIIASKNSVA
jgi:hypothetical protein